jgi:hypothetical protein
MLPSYLTYLLSTGFEYMYIVICLLKWIFWYVFTCEMEDLTVPDTHEKTNGYRYEILPAPFVLTDVYDNIVSSSMSRRHAYWF